MTNPIREPLRGNRRRAPINHGWLLLAIAWTTCVLVVNAQPGSMVSRIKPWWLDIVSIDKVAHFVFYFVIAFSWFRAFQPASTSLRPQLRNPGVFALLLATCLGSAEELNQSYFIVGRSGEIADFIMDVIGAMVGVACCWLLNPRRSRQPS